MKTIPLPGGRAAQVDDCDFDRISRHAWHVAHNGYAIRRVRREDGSKFMVFMHREVFGWVARDVDHRDGNKLNCTRDNLRAASRMQNCGNQRMRGGSSSFKGVCWAKSLGKWVAYIRRNKRRQHLGVFTDERAAAAAYNAAALNHFGEFARINQL